MFLKGSFSIIHMIELNSGVSFILHGRFLNYNQAIQVPYKLTLENFGPHTLKQPRYQQSLFQHALQYHP